MIGRAAAVADVFGVQITGFAGVAHLGFYPPFVSHHAPDPYSGLYPMGDPGPHIQSWCSPDHR